MLRAPCLCADTYAIGITLQGVQAFDYRGAARRSTPGQVFVLHPDELHDGRAGSAAGFRYRILYVDPGRIGAALGDGRPLPFVCDAVFDDRRLLAAVAPALADLDLPLEDLRHDQIVAGLAQALAEADRSVPRRPPSRLDQDAARRARACLDAGFARAVQQASSKRSRVSGATRSPATSAPASGPAPTATWCCGASIGHGR